jgi:hypothetical protein
LRHFVPQKPRFTGSCEASVRRGLQGKESPNRRFLEVLCAKRNKLPAVPGGARFMVRIPGADSAGPPGRADRAGALQKNVVPEAGKSPGGGDKSGPASSRPLQNTEKSIPPPAAGSRGLPKTLAGLAQTLGLPRDSLSAAILSFARYFSLPLNPGLVAKIRRESLSAVPAEAPQDEALSPRGPEARNTAAFAAAAAASKGLELSREGLKAYAAAIDPGYPEKHSGDSAGNPGADSGQNSGGSTGGGDSGPGNHKNGEAEDDPRQNAKAASPGGLDRGGLIGPDTLREKILEIEGQNPLLDLLNRVPGKNGERWITLPFAFTQGGREYRVSLRIHLTAPRAELSPGCLVMDISGGPRDKPVLRRRFIYDTLSGGPRLQARFWPPEDKGTLRSLQKELSQLFPLQMTHINLKNDEEYNSFVKVFPDDILPTINEEV